MLVYSPNYHTPLEQFGIVKPFALDRGKRVLAALAQDLGHLCTYVEPKPLSESDVLLVHSLQYLQSLKDPLQAPDTWHNIFELKDNEYFPEKATRPLSELWDDIALKCGGTLLAAELALKYGLSANLGGGYHHAFPDQGRGFCVINDIAVAIRSLQKRNLAKKVLVVDLDFHQGDGTALIFQGDPDVFTLSVHSEEGWPEEKQMSTLDVSLRENEIQLYQEKMEEALHKALSVFKADLAIYVAGSDPYEKDVLPGTRFMKLTLDQMRQRDEFVIDAFYQRQIPLAMVFAGGYGDDVWEVHYYAVRYLLQLAGVLSNMNTL